MEVFNIPFSSFGEANILTEITNSFTINTRCWESIRRAAGYVLTNKIGANRLRGKREIGSEIGLVVCLFPAIYPSLVGAAKLGKEKKKKEKKKKKRKKDVRSLGYVPCVHTHARWELP